MFLEQKLCNSLKLLEIGQDVSLDNIKKAYRKMAKKYHPDLFLSKSKEALSAENKMKMINEAKELIDNFIDMHGLDELLRIYKTTNKINEFITLEEVGDVCSKDSELIVLDTIMNNYLEINAKRIFKILYSAIERQCSSQRHFIYVLDSALKKLKDNGCIIVTDKITYSKNNGVTHEPYGKWYVTGNDSVSHYYTSSVVRVLDSLNINEGDTIPVKIKLRKILKDELLVFTNDDEVLFQIEKCGSYIEYLIENGVIKYEKAELYRGKTKNYQRNNGEIFVKIEDSLLNIYFIPANGEWDISELKEIENGSEMQKREIFKVYGNNSVINYPKRHFENIYEQLNTIFIHHREVVPNSKRLGMFYISFNNKSLIYTPTEMSENFLKYNDITNIIFREMFEMMLFISTIIPQMSSDIAKEYIRQKGKCHYHVGDKIISIMTFHKASETKYTGVHIRFYIKNDDLCLYDLPTESRNYGNLQSLKNLGPEMIKKLNAIGIRNSNGLNSISTEDIVLKLLEKNYFVDYIMMYSIEGAKRELKISKIPDERKKELKEFLKKHL